MEKDLFRVIDQLSAYLAEPAHGADRATRAVERAARGHDREPAAPPYATLYDMALRLASRTLTEGDALAEICDIAIRAARGQRGGVMVAGAGELAWGAARDHRCRDLADPNSLGISDKDAAEILRDGRPRRYVGKRLSADPIEGVAVPIPMVLPIKSFLGEDRRSARRAALDEGLGKGLLCVARDREAFADDELAALSALVPPLASFLAVQRQQRALFMDPLTGLYSRQNLLGQFESLLDHHRRGGIPLSVVFLDVDGFRAFNQRAGAAVGDLALRRLALVLSQSMRHDDAAFRYGADKFVVLLPATAAEGAAIFARGALTRLHAGLAADARFAGLSVSAGLASCPEHGDDAAILLERADQALFLSKAVAKGEFRLWEPDIGLRAPRTDRLAGILTGDSAVDYKNVLALVDAVGHVFREPDPRKFLQKMLDKLLFATGAERGAILLEDRGRLEVAVARSAEADGEALFVGAGGDEPSQYSRSVAERVFRTGEPVCLSNALKLRDISTSIRDLRLRTVVCVPLHSSSASLGVLYLDGRAESSSLSEAHLPLFGAISRQAGLAIENARLKARMALLAPTEGIDP